MTAYEIPLSATDQRFQIPLNGITYQLTVKWCAPASSWTLDIADEGGTALVSGIPIVTGIDLLEQYQHIGIAGQIVAQTDGDTFAVPTQSNLGAAGHLYFIATDTASVAASSSAYEAPATPGFNALSALGALAPDAGAIIVGTGATWITETGATARTTLGAQAADADLDALAGLSTTGLVARTGAGTAATRTITATANGGVTVTNGDGVSGNPALALGSYLPARTSAVARTVASKLNESLSVLDFGADPTGSADSYTAFVNAIAVMSTYGAGSLYVPTGTYKMSAQLDCPSYINIYGDGPSSSILDFNTSTSGYGLYFNGPNKYVINIMNIGVINGYSSNIYFNAANLISLENVVSRYSKNGHGLHTVNTWMISIKQCDFWDNHSNGGRFIGPTTSLSVVGSYALTNGVSGWYIDECVYSSFITSGSDSSTAGYGYELRNIGGMVFIGCGAEENAYGAWLAAASTAIGAGKTTVKDIYGVVLSGCCTVNNGTAAAYYSSFLEVSSVDSKPVEITLLECYEFSSNSGISILVDAGSPTIRRIGGTYAGTVDATIVDIGTEAGRLTYLNSASFAANGSVATAMSSVGPTGSHTSVQEWLKINHNGTTRYVPLF